MVKEVEFLGETLISPLSRHRSRLYGTFSWALSSCCFRFWLGQLDLRIYVSVQLVTGRGYMGVATHTLL